MFVRGIRTRIRKKHRTGAGWPMMKVGVQLVVPIHVGINRSASGSQVGIAEG